MGCKSLWTYRRLVKPEPCTKDLTESVEQVKTVKVIDGPRNITITTITKY